MSNRYIYTLLVLGTILTLGLTRCRSGEKDWKSPEVIYDQLCICENSQGQTIDAAWKELMRSKNVTVNSPDEVIRSVGSNTNMLFEMVDSLFLSDEVYLSSLKTANDTLLAHGAEMEVKGKIEELFSVRSRYPACVSSINYILQR